MANMWRGKGPAKKLKDFLPEWGERKKQTPEDMALYLKALTVSLGGKIVGGNNREPGSPIKP